ncbi:hypothetical protein MGSAQ_003234, partial [marine sediment metagenome]
KGDQTNHRNIINEYWYANLVCMGTQKTKTL